MDSEELLSRIDISQPGDLAEGDELRELEAQLERDPALRRAADRLRQLDRRIIAALEDVPVPAGLTERILHSLSQGAGVEDAGESESVIPLSGAQPRDRGPRIPRVRRRTALIAAAVASAAAIALYLGFRSPTPQYGPDVISSIARELFDQERNQAVAEAAAPSVKGYPSSSVVVQLATTRPRRLEDFLGRSGVAYDLKRGGIRACLYVVKISAGPRMPRIETSQVAGQPRPASTGGLTTAVWREQGYLYVLVVEGGEAEYRQFLAVSPIVA